MKRAQRGFTLIELLIVVAIIGILSSLLMVNFVGIRQRARDAQRKSNLRQFQSALELYRSDQGEYPVTSAVAPANPVAPCGQGNAFQGGSPLNTYLQTIPCDPLNAGEYIYSYVSDGSTYTLYTCMENVADSQKDTTNNSGYCTGGTTNWSYTLTNP